MQQANRGLCTLPRRALSNSATAIESWRAESPQRNSALVRSSGSSNLASSLSSTDLHNFNSFLCQPSFQDPATLNPPDSLFYDLLPPNNSVSLDPGIYPSLSPHVADQQYAATSTALPDLDLNLSYDPSGIPSFPATTVPSFPPDQALLDPTGFDQSEWLNFSSNHPDSNQLSFPTRSESLNSSSMNTSQSSSPKSHLQSTSSTSFNCSVGNDPEPPSTRRIDPPTSVPARNGSTEGSGNGNSPAVDEAAEKRRRNTLAARRFRKKQQDRVARLEEALEKVTKERDELKMRAARWEGEVAALRKMLAGQKKN